MNRRDAGDLIRETRLRLGLTQEQLAEGICDPATLSRIESGSRNAGDRILSKLMERIGLGPQKTVFSADPAFLMLETLKDQIRQELLAERLSQAEELLVAHQRWMEARPEGSTDEYRFASTAVLLLEAMQLERLRNPDPMLLQHWHFHALGRAAAILQSFEQKDDGCFYAGGDSFPELSPEETELWTERYSADAAAFCWEQLAAWNLLAASYLYLEEPVVSVRIWSSLIRHGNPLDGVNLMNRAEEALSEMYSTEAFLKSDREQMLSAVNRQQTAVFCANLAVACTLLGQKKFAADYIRRARRLLRRSDPMNLWARVEEIRRAVGKEEAVESLLIRMV